MQWQMEKRALEKHMPNWEKMAVSFPGLLFFLRGYRMVGDAACRNLNKMLNLSLSEKWAKQFVLECELVPGASMAQFSWVWGPWLGVIPLVIHITTEKITQTITLVSLLFSGDPWLNTASHMTGSASFILRWHWLSQTSMWSWLLDLGRYFVEVQSKCMQK